MCGILGYFSLSGSEELERTVLDEMADTVKHRGPDAAGQVRTTYAAFGFRRLSIIGLEGGDQPIFNEDRSLVLVCNGEIFNYKELKAQLVARGHRFGSSSDVEVLLHLYEEQGPEMLLQVNGQFAFALLDMRNRQMLLARDHVGVAPLHYCVSGNSFVFGSEIKSILKHPAVKAQVNLTGVDQVFTFPGIISPQTLFRGVHRLQPGHFLLVNESGVQDREYWDIDYPLMSDVSDDTTESDYIEGLADAFTRSVRYRLQSEVPVGLYVSGGLDSSLIAALVHKLDPTKTRRAFSIGFSDARADEGRYQRLVAEKANCDLHTAHFDSSRTAEMMRTMVYHAECPVKETYNTCSYALSRAARQAGIKVVLSGEGADELFAGYVGYRFDRMREGRSRKVVPAGTLSAEEQLSESLWGDRNVRYELNYADHQKQRFRLYSEDVRAEFNTFDCLTKPLVRKDRITGRHPVHQRSYLDFKLRMADHLLMDHGDAMALANSVEVRYPFLDVDFIRYATRIPPDLKLKGYTEKYALRRMGENLVPPEILRREKFGWYAPGSPEMLQKGVEWIQDVLSRDTIKRQGYFDPDEIELLKNRYSTPGFKLNQPFESDWLMVVATFGLLQEVFQLPSA